MESTTIELPPHIHPKALEAIEEFVDLCARGFTGDFTAYMKNGVPENRDVTDRRKYGRPLTGRV